MESSSDLQSRTEQWRGGILTPCSLRASGAFLPPSLCIGLSLPPGNPSPPHRLSAPEDLKEDQPESSPCWLKTPPWRLGYNPHSFLWTMHPLIVFQTSQVLPTPGLLYWLCRLPGTASWLSPGRLLPAFEVSAQLSLPQRNFPAWAANLDTRATGTWPSPRL